VNSFKFFYKESYGSEKDLLINKVSIKNALVGPMITYKYIDLLLIKNVFYLPEFLMCAGTPEEPPTNPAWRPGHERLSGPA